MTYMRANRAHAHMVGDMRKACERAHVARWREGMSPYKTGKVSQFLASHVG